MAEWIHPETIIGDAAEGKKYFRREAIEKKLWRELNKGNYVLFNAPRRTGKSSIMKYMADNCLDNWICYYENISSDKSSKDFYSRLLRMVLQQLEKKKLWTGKMADIIQTIGIESVSMTGIKFKSNERDIDYKSKLLTLIPEMKETNCRLVLFLDEFPDVISNISKNESSGAALDILQTLRSLAHNKEFKKHFSLVLAGSIGLDHVVKKIDRTNHINSYRRVKLDHLVGKQPEEFVTFLTHGASMKFTPETTEYLTAKLQKPIPYFIQLLVEECNDLLCEANRTDITQPDIDQAWERVLEQHEHFQDWVERLEQHCTEELPYLMAVLTKTAHNNYLTVQELYDMGKEHNYAHEYKAILDDILIRDGYLDEDNQKFSFISPLLQEWWKRRYPIHEV